MADGAAEFGGVGKFVTLIPADAQDGHHQEKRDRQEDKCAGRGNLPDGDVAFDAALTQHNADGAQCQAGDENPREETKAHHADVLVGAGLR